MAISTKKPAKHRKKATKVTALGVKKLPRLAVAGLVTLVVAVGGVTFTAISNAATASSKAQTHSYSSARTGIRAIAGGVSVNVRWDLKLDKTKVKGYRVYRNNVKIATTAPGSSIKLVDQDGMRYDDTKIKPGVIYNYQVAPLYKDGTVGKRSKIARVRTPTKTTPTPTITVDASNAKNLDKWAKNVVIPELKTWYPKIADRLAGSAYTPPKQFTIKFSSKLSPGTAGITLGTTITLSSTYFSKPYAQADVGTVVHESVHVIQHYLGPHGPTVPSWLIESIADYGQNILYADHPAIAKSNQYYTDGYQPGAAFLDWIERNYEPNAASKLNQLAHANKLNVKTYKFANGKTFNEAWADMLNIAVRR